MGSVQLPTARGNFLQAPSTTFYNIVGIGCSGYSTTEAYVGMPFRHAGTLSQLLIVVTVNDEAATTVTSRKNAGAGNQSVTVPSSTTGTFVDATNTDTVAVGDVMNLSIVTGAGGATFTWRHTSVLFASADGYVTVYAGAAPASAAISFSTAGVTQYLLPPGGFALVPTATESNVQILVPGPATWRGFAIYVSANARTTTTTFKARINGADGNGALAVTSTATGLFQDTSGTDVLAGGETINWSITTGTGAETITWRLTKAEMVSPLGHVNLLGGTSLVAVAVALTRSWLVAAPDAVSGAVATRLPLQRPVRASNLHCNVTANTIVESSTVTLFKNGSAATQVLTITGLTTGLFQDTTHTDDFLIGDLVNYTSVTGATGTSLTLSNIGMLLLCLDDFSRTPSRGMSQAVHRAAHY